ncbi:hypothetical protein HOV38_gp51 [Raoultella phage RP180]|uniref:Uncharacterized protein n=1 Tax=Raoultella phage RP180 TaxID=2565500 RepID=A0A4D6DZT1_9CAUD|nr:hypothetical protein HOV38_gp51 [Raoultella phage RP180]QBZ71306.1 hypothetical protein RP180_51 [Raoultella phage RP180]
MSNKHEVFEYLIDQLRQQVNNNQCEDLAHEVLSLKNQLRDASALVAELQGDNIKKSEHISHLTGRVKELHMALAAAAGDVEAYKLIRGQEQSGCRKEDAQECKHDWYFYDKGASMACKKCGLKSPGRQKEDAQECYHNWQFVNGKAPAVCVNCGVTKSSECEHDWEYYYPNGRRCTKCGLVNL